MTTETFSNRDVARALQDLADMMRLNGDNRFRVAAVDKAATNVLEMEIGIKEMVASDQLESLDGVGKGIAKEIKSLFSEGELEGFAALRQTYPPGLLDILRLPNIGPKKALVLWQELGVASLSDLAQAAQAEKVQAIKGFTKRSEGALLASIEKALSRPPEGEPIGLVLPVVESLIGHLRTTGHDLVVEAVPTGDLRRWQETIDRAEILASTLNADGILQLLRELPPVSQADWIEAGHLIRAELHMGLLVDVTVCEPEKWAWQLMQTTGDAEFRRNLESFAQERGLESGSQDRVCMKSNSGSMKDPPIREADLFAQMGLSFVVPEQRSVWATPDLHNLRDPGRLVSETDLLGELHAHSTFSDGRNTIAEMAQAAIAKGYRYWGVTDHGLGHGFGDSLDAAALQLQATEIGELNKTFAEQGLNFRLLRGIEAEILADGSLGLDDEVLEMLDVVVASIHSSLRQDAETITNRCLRVIHNPHVDVLGHPSSRLLGRRDPSALDISAILQACAETETAVEINCNPSRLDLRDVYARQAADLGCQLVLNCDAHGVSDLDVLRYGMGVARRAGLTPEDVLNTRPLDELLDFLQTN